ncbi:hypothetical protein [Maricaulis sp.]|uniref:hypothetical protein n=1 Tax=Maricaulis sp. TaxID=1486257 RepID=UPI003A93E16C
MMSKLILLASCALAMSACTNSSYGPAENRSTESAGLVASRNLDVTGDAELAGMLVRADGTVGRDLELAGARVSSSASVGGDLSAAGASVRFTGSVGGNAEIAAATTWLDADFGGDLDVAGARVTIDGRVAGRLELHGARMNLKGDFLGPVEVIGEGRDDGERIRNGRAILAGNFSQGAFVCATHVEFRNSARFGGALRVIASERPEGGPSGYEFELLDGRDCDQINI